MHDQIREAIFQTWLEESRKIFDCLDHFDHNSIRYQVSICNGLIASSIAFDSIVNDKFLGRTSGQQRSDFGSAFGDILTNGSTEQALIDAINKLKRETDRAPIIHMADSRQRAVMITDVRSLHNIMDVIYRVRSNLVHGGKELYDQRNINLIDSSFQALYLILKQVGRHSRF
jgi:hypothetical protein